MSRCQKKQTIFKKINTFLTGISARRCLRSTTQTNKQTTTEDGNFNRDFHSRGPTRGVAHICERFTSGSRSWHVQVLSWPTFSFLNQRHLMSSGSDIWWCHTAVMMMSSLTLWKTCPIIEEIQNGSTLTVVKVFSYIHCSSYGSTCQHRYQVLIF